jgi:hypothetical protein
MPFAATKERPSFNYCTRYAAWHAEHDGRHWIITRYQPDDLQPIGGAL